MRFSAKLAVISTLFAVLGCTEPYRSQTSTTPAYGSSSQVISSPPGQSSSTGGAYSGSTPTAGSQTYGTQSAGTQTYGTSSSSQQSYASTDQALTERVQEALRSNNSVSGFAQNLQVSVRNGAVTLTGPVPGDQDRQTVDNLVRNVSGVVSVYDQLQVQPSATGRVEGNSAYENQSQQQQSQNQGQSQPGQFQQNQGTGTFRTGDIFSLHVQGLNQTDRSLAERILQGLQTDQALASQMPTVNINVTGGRVVLEGNVQSEQQRQTIGNVVQRAAGASNVENQLQVSPAR